jgi:acetyl esterase
MLRSHSNSHDAVIRVHDAAAHVIDRVAAPLCRERRGSRQRFATASARPGIAVLLLLASSAIAQQPQRTFTFKQTPQGPLEITVDYPADWKPIDARPAIVFFFGGGWTKGSVEEFSRQAAYFATRGMVAIRADYRIASKHHTEPDAAVEDGRTALSWVRSHANELGLDPNRIVAAGGSSGGHLAACTAQCPVDVPAFEDSTVSLRPNALILFNPALDYGGLVQLPAPFSEVFQAFPKLMQDTALQHRISPVLHVEHGDPPTLLLFGTDDPLLGPARLYADKLKTAGVRVEIFTADGVGHGFFNNSPWYERTLYRADKFLASLGYIKGPPTISKP